LTAALLSVCACTSGAQGATLLVPSQYFTIQAAINASNHGDVIRVSPGVWPPFNYNGRRVTVESVSGPLITVIDPTGVSGTCVWNAGWGNGAALRGFTLVNATDSAVRVWEGASLSIENCRFRNCSSSNMEAGGALNVVGATVWVSGSNFDQSTSARDDNCFGGAVYARSSTVSFLSCSFVDCNVTAQSHPGDVCCCHYYRRFARGGAIYATSTNLTVDRCTFSRCRANATVDSPQAQSVGTGWDSDWVAQGGAIFSEHGTSVVTDCVFGSSGGCSTAATATRRPVGCGGTTRARADGGAISLLGGTPTLRDNTFLGNQAQSDVYAYSGNGTHVPVTASAFGAHVHMEAPTNPTVQGSYFSGGVLRADVSSVDGWNDPGSVTIDRGGGALMWWPAAAGSLVNDAVVIGVSGPTAVEVRNGAAVSLIDFNVLGSSGVALKLVNNGAFVSSCEFRDGGSAPIHFTGTGAGFLLFDSLICGNTSNVIVGNWLNGGGNRFSSSCEMCIGDIDGDLTVGSSDLTNLLAAWGQSVPTADLNADTAVDGKDLGILLSSWGPCD
jgi:hypothetical protein